MRGGKARGVRGAGCVHAENGAAEGRRVRGDTSREKSERACKVRSGRECHGGRGERSGGECKGRRSGSNGRECEVSEGLRDERGGCVHAKKGAAGCAHARGAGAYTRKRMQQDVQQDVYTQEKKANG